MYLKHGLSKTPEYKCWQQIKCRCLDPNHRAYPNYGGRGITIHEAWRYDFEAFFVHVGPRPSERHSLDRIDVNGNYEPGNVRWATWQEQAQNRRPHGTAEGFRSPVQPGRVTNFKHGLIRMPEYRAWGMMKDRCFNLKSSNYPNWGGRGITIDPKWSDDFEMFLAHVGPRPSPQHSLDRIDNGGNYEPGNVRWATRLEQTQNRRPYRTGASHGNFEHGGVGTPEYKTWGSIKTRCFNPKHDRYRDYGGVGITMCQGWRGSFPDFLEDMGAKPSPEHTVGRIDVSGHYSCGTCSECVAQGWPANCRWATAAEQNQNRRPSERSGKLTLEKVAVMRQMLADHRSRKEVAKVFGVGTSLVGKIERREVWV